MRCEKCGFEVFGNAWKRTSEGKVLCLDCFNKGQKKLNEEKEN